VVTPPIAVAVRLIPLVENPVSARWLLLGGIVTGAADVAVVDEFLLCFLCLVFDILVDERRQLVRLGIRL